MGGVVKTYFLLHYWGFSISLWNDRLDLYAPSRKRITARPSKPLRILVYSFLTVASAVQLWRRLLYLSNWGRVKHICVRDFNILGSDYGLWPGGRQAIIWTSAGILLSRILGRKFSEIVREIHTFWLKKCIWKGSRHIWMLIFKIRLLYDQLIFKVEVPIPLKSHLYLQTTYRWHGKGCYHTVSQVNFHWIKNIQREWHSWWLWNSYKVLSLMQSLHSSMSTLPW